MSEKYEGTITSREYVPEDDGGGMGINGRWINKHTGKIINVRNTIIDGDNMIIITDNGQIPMNVFSRDYIQTSDELYDESGKVVGHEAIQADDYGASEEWMQIQEMMNSNTQNIQQQTKLVNTNDNIIKKVFEKLSSYPEIKVDIKWDNFPSAQLNTLVNFLDISIDDIAKYITKNYINLETLSKSINNILIDKIDNQKIDTCEENEQ